MAEKCPLGLLDNTGFMGRYTAGHDPTPVTELCPWSLQTQLVIEYIEL